MAVIAIVGRFLEEARFNRHETKQCFLNRCQKESYRISVTSYESSRRGTKYYLSREGISITFDEIHDSNGQVDFKTAMVCATNNSTTCISTG